MEQKIIKPYHLFNHQGSWYAINVQEMSAAIIDDATAGMLETINTEQPVRIESHTEEQLKEFIPVVNMSLFLTQSCNLRCVYCYGDGGKYGDGGNMEEKTAFQAVDWLVEQSGKIKKLHIGFFGGEPFLNFSLMKAVVEYAEKRVQEVGKQVDFNVTTNGTLLDDHKIAFIKEHQISVMISFDGPKEIQDAQRPYANGEGTYDDTVPKIKKLLAVLPETPVNAVIVGNTDCQLVKVGLQDIGFTQISIVPASESLFNGEIDQAKLSRDIRVLLQALEQEAEAWIDLIKSRNCAALKCLMVKSGLYEGLIALLHNIKRYYGCDAGRGLVGVSCTGDVYLCHRFVGQDAYKLGSVFEKDLNREKYQESPATTTGVCAACFARYYCAGGCKHDNVCSSGSITTPAEDMCRLRCRQLELAATVVGRLGPDDRAFLVEQQIFPPKPCPLDF